MNKETRHQWTDIEFKGDDHEYHVSHSVCKICGMKRKKRRYLPDMYQSTSGVITLVKPGVPVPPCIKS